MSKLVAVKLSKSHGIFNAGETAGFPSGEAAKLVKAGGAVYLTADKPEATPNKAATPEPKARGFRGRRGRG